MGKIRPWQRLSFKWWKKSLLKRFFIEKLFLLEIKWIGKAKQRPLYSLLPGIIKDHQYFRAFLHEKTRVLYLLIPKVASTSIKRTLLESEAVRTRLDEEASAYHKLHPKNFQYVRFKGDDINASVFGEREVPSKKFRRNLNKIKGAYYGAWTESSNKRKFIICGYNPEKDFEERRVDIDHINQYFIFTFVRNPFVRFVSCFIQKYERKEKNDMFVFNQPSLSYIKYVRGFADLSHKIQQIPHAYLDIHLMPQHLILDRFKKWGGKIDFIGKLEEIDKEFEPIRKKYNLLSLETINPSGANKKWRDYYTPEIAKRVYETFHEDFVRFGYEDEYPKLLDHLEKKS